MPAPIRVLLDVTHFGVVQADLSVTHNRTGIFRTIEQTVRSLSTHPGVALTLCSRESTDAAVAFVEAHADFRSLPFRPGRHRLAHRLQAHVRDEYARNRGHAPGALPWRVASKAARLTNRALDPRFGALSRAVLSRADVYHSPLYALPPSSARAPGVRYWLTVYDTIPILFPEWSSWDAAGWQTGILNTIGPDDHVLTISEHTRRDLLTVRPDLGPERVHVALLAADPARFYPCDNPARRAAVRAKYGIPDAPYLLSVATMEPRKNIPRLMNAFADLVRAGRLGDVRLVLTGSKGWDHAAVDAAAAGLGHVRDRVHFTGYVDDADLAPLYSGALAFVYPSLYEGFGLPPLEAMQCGTPVITGNTSSLPEVVADAGIMVDPRDTDAFAQAILDVYSDAERRASLARRALARAREFSWARYARQTVTAYRAALARA